MRKTKIITNKDTHHVKIITGNGGNDLKFFHTILKENEKDYCEIIVYISIGEANALKHKSLKGIFNFIKMDKDKLYIVIIDKEHIREEFNEDLLKRNAEGIEIINLVKITNEIYKILCKIGSRECIVYFLILGTFCCFEEEVLRIISNYPLPNYTGEGCCKEYKKILKGYQNKKDVNVYQELKVKEHFYKKLKEILCEISKTVR